MCGSMVDIQSPTAEIRWGKKERQKPHGKNIIVCPITVHTATIKNLQFINGNRSKTTKSLKGNINRNNNNVGVMASMFWPSVCPSVCPHASHIPLYMYWSGAKPSSISQCRGCRVVAYGIRFSLIKHLGKFQRSYQRPPLRHMCTA